ncbi:hypothetical protein BBJ29_001362 [Phytophthora kernoviae]|uniref:RGS domain-containing protein n=1 Tax=Phytophthora kernoviae TaxID=325452 RepID=A0A3F2RU30_9STRA|nr:hypothetical protein BBJ29_001362 [Phytophthora kernoviae]RLN64283.1 hypothetical protein BBP00_00003563 [Phytophthora kernoviae]
MATSMLLQSLDTMKCYKEAVHTCQHAYSVRVRSLPDTHQSVLEIIEQLDEFISKRETVEMINEDFILLARNEYEKKCREELANESERHLAEFRDLLLKDPEGLAKFLLFARQEFAEDLIEFWIAIEEFRETKLDTKTLRSRAVHAYLTYIESRRVKIITAAQRKKIKKAITIPGKKISHSLYDDVQAQIFDLVYTGVYVRYLAQVK